MMDDPNCRVCIIQEVKYNLIRRSYFQPGESFMPLNVENIRAICFDVDGTLSDTDDLFVHKLEQILRPSIFSFLIMTRNAPHVAS
jgi:hypothetical protein